MSVMKLHEIIVLFLMGCVAAFVLGTGSSCGKSASSTPPNLATLLVTTTLEPDAKCTPYFTDAGEQHVHSAECRFPNKARIYCRLAADDKIPHCETIFDPNAKQAASSAPAPAAPPPTPAPAPAEAPPPKAP